MTITLSLPQPQTYEWPVLEHSGPLGGCSGERPQPSHKAPPPLPSSGGAAALNTSAQALATGARGACRARSKERG